MDGVLNFLRSRRDSLEDTDFEIVVGNEEGKVHKKAHKFILRQSPYFAALFRMNGQEMQKNSVEIPDISAESMDLVLDYMYGKEPALTKYNALEVARAANYLQLNQLRIHCINEHIKSYEGILPNGVMLGLQDLIDNADIIIKGDSKYLIGVNNLVKNLLVYSTRWTNIHLLSYTTLTQIVLYKRIPNVVFYIINEWNKLAKPSGKRLESLINLYFEGIEDKVNMPPLAIAMLAKLEIMNKTILSRFNSDDLMVATKGHIMRSKLKGERWGTFQLDNTVLCMFHFNGFHEPSDKKETYEMFTLVILRIVNSARISITLKNNKDKEIAKWEKVFDSEKQVLKATLTLRSWREFQKEVLDLTDPEERWCSLCYQLVSET